MVAFTALFLHLKAGFKFSFTIAFSVIRNSIFNVVPYIFKTHTKTVRIMLIPKAFGYLQPSHDLVFDQCTIHHIPCGIFIFKIQDLKTHFFYLVAVSFNSQELAGFNILYTCTVPLAGHFIINSSIIVALPTSFLKRGRSKAATGIDIPVNCSFLTSVIISV
jgi:hypothetical protein